VRFERWEVVTEHYDCSGIPADKASGRLLVREKMGVLSGYLTPLGAISDSHVAPNYAVVDDHCRRVTARVLFARFYPWRRFVVWR